MNETTTKTLRSQWSAASQPHNQESAGARPLWAQDTLPLTMDKKNLSLIHRRTEQPQFHGPRVYLYSLQCMT